MKAVRQKRTIQERHGPYRYCRQCDYFTRKANTLSMHVANTHGNNVHDCKLCNMSFPTRGKLFHHNLSYHTEGTVKCQKAGCELLFKSETNHRIHYVRKHLDCKEMMMNLEYDKSFWKCTTCGKEQKKQAIMYHVASCSPLSPFSALGKLEPLNDDDESFFYTCRPCDPIAEVVVEEDGPVEHCYDINFDLAISDDAMKDDSSDDEDLDMLLNSVIA